MSEANYYKVKLNNGDKHILYADQEELEGMVSANIIDDYQLALENWDTGKVYHQYICDRLEAEVHDICYYIQMAKGIKNGDCPPDLHCELDSVIENVYQVIMKIISYEEENENEKEKG